MNFCSQCSIAIFLTLAPLANVLAQDNNIQAQLSLPLTKQYLSQLEALKEDNQWAQITTLGEKAYDESIKQGDAGQAFLIADQLLSTYYRLGEFKKALFYGDKMELLAGKIDTPIFVVNAFYKSSAAFRGMANEAPIKEQKELFNQARKLIQKSLLLLNEKCEKEKALAARVYFNAGALEEDDPLGDLGLAEDFLKKAERLFLSLAENDFHQRSSIRLGKVYLLQGKVPLARAIINGLSIANLEKRTNMQLLYLEAQVLWEEGKQQEALNKALKAKEIALSLGARADLMRFEQFIAAFPKGDN